jgi:hypothetical protein
LTPENIFKYRLKMANQWGLEHYKGFLIDGSAVPTFATGFDWYSQGVILRPGRVTSIVEVRRIKGPIFNSKEAAEEHGLKLCRDWIDKRP